MGCGMKHIALLLGLLALSACSIMNGSPPKPSGLLATIGSLDSTTLAALVSEYNNAATDPARKKLIRNRIIYSDIGQVDQNFNDFKIDLNNQANTINVSADFISLALAGLGATTGNAGTKSALAAASAGVIGANAAFDKDVLYQKTVVALVTEMEAQRSQVFARIIANTNRDVTQYPLELAGKDLQDYYQAGTLVNAIAGVNKSASENAQNGAKAVETALSAQYNYTNLSQKIRSYWMPDGTTVDMGHQTNLDQCLTETKFPGSIPFLINGGTEGEKAAVIGCLNI
jgi:hypothetical protein